MEPKLGLYLIEQFAALGGEDLLVTGGEPLEHESLVHFLRHGKSKSLRTTLFSMGVDGSGKAVSGDQVQSLSKYLDVWRVSLHSPRPELHDALTNRDGSFTATCNAVRTIVGAGVEVRSTFFAHPENLSQLSETARLCERLGVAEMRVVTIVPQGRGRSKGRHYNVAGREVAEAIQEANKLAHIAVRLGEAAKASYDLRNECRAVEEEMVVNWAGWASPCHAVEPFPSDSEYDNAFLKPLAEVLRRSPRLDRCQREARRAHPSGCETGCLVRRALLAEHAPGPHKANALLER